MRQLLTQANEQRIGEVSAELVDAVSERLRDAIASPDLRVFIAAFHERLRDN